MKRYAAAAVLTLAALTLGACDERHEMAANSKLCVDFKQPKATPIVAGAEGAAPMEECVKRWAYSLAGSRDTADTVAEAAVAACNVQLSRWNQQTLNQPGADIEASSITTGQPTTPLAEHSAFAESRALFYVVQARAGSCAPPPVTNGVPDGIS
ncbi:MAG TPA: hypothetical protein VNW53_14450 [Phenylobacterium sp.]|jgi:hypothetical protein|uniref:hypothetical protein n=1 Tax=Phenylobacterium sp. TaxID=1871053 RepID=UPI002BCF486B|nr:hypothetical protein [Phenylobacterium sp.]HXA40197.1 hypothetical protein [Phenylobacterium sp.]